MPPSRRVLRTDADWHAVIAEIVAGARASDPTQTLVIAIDGLGGSGKSTLAEAVAAKLMGAVVHTDDFSGCERPREWWGQLIEVVLAPVARGEPVQPFERARWTLDEPTEIVSIPPTRYLVLEGVRAASLALAPYVGYAILLDVPLETRRARATIRYGGRLPEAWDAWSARQNAYLREERPDERADLVAVDLR